MVTDVKGIYGKEYLLREKVILHKKSSAMDWKGKFIILFFLWVKKGEGKILCSFFEAQNFPCSNYINKIKAGWNVSEEKVNEDKK